MQSQHNVDTYNSSSSLGRGVNDLPPRYESVTSATRSGNSHPSVFRENEYGEMKPAEQNVVRDPSATGPIEDHFVENQYGEIHRAVTDPELLGADSSSSPHDFGSNTPQKAKEYCSNETYPENRFGELGRADTFVEEEGNIADKLKGTAEQIIGKLTGNKELHDKGVIRKSVSPVR